MTMFLVLSLRRGRRESCAIDAIADMSSGKYLPAEIFRTFSVGENYPSFMSLIVSNTLFAVAFSWYFYITHLGYISRYVRDERGVLGESRPCI